MLKIDIMILLQTYLMYLNFFCCSKSKVQDSVDSKLINTGTKNLMYRDQDIISLAMHCKLECHPGRLYACISY